MAEALANLRNILADLFQDEDAIRSLVHDAEIDHRQIKFQSSANLIWHSVIDEARKQERLAALFREAQKVYPKNHALQAAIAEYQQLANTKSNAKPDLESSLDTQASSNSPPVLPYIRGLWPLPLSSGQSPIADANYDFPDSDLEFEQFGGIATYTIQESESVDKTAHQQPKLSTESLCRQFLVPSNHQIVIARKGAGKTWLRLYLDRYITITEQETYPLFFFALSTLLFQIDEKKILESLAASVANQLFANMLRQSTQHERNTYMFLATRIGIAPFLSRHHYNLPSEIQSLSQPVPQAALLDIDRHYKDNPLYIEIRRLMASGEERAGDITVDQILSDISTMMTIMGLQRLIILIDNWESVATQARVKMISQLLNESLLKKLSSHNIFFKLFVPTMKFEMPDHFYQNSLLTRHTDSRQYELSLFTYHESSH